MVVGMRKAHLCLAGGATPPILAARCGDVQEMESLKSQGYDLKAVDSAGRNIMHNAALCRNVPVLKWALENTDIDTKAKDIHGLSVGHLAVINADCQCSGQILSNQVDDNAVAQ